MSTSRISAIVQVRVESLECVYYRKKELLYILIASPILLASLIYSKALIFLSMYADGFGPCC